MAILKTHPDPDLEKRIESIINTIERAQRSDGYLISHLQLTEPGYDLFSHETSRTCESYSMGHLIESAVEHYRLTGKTNYLGVAERAADLMVKVNQEGKHLQISGHPQVEIGLIKLYQATGKQAYLDLAQRLVNGYKTRISRWSNGKAAMADDDVLGHAVSVMYLYSGAMDVAMLKDDAALLDLLKRKWERMVSRKMYVTGGVGHRKHHEGFPADYDLPVDEQVYCETCSAIANVFWSYRLFRATGEARYMDLFERVLYNNLAAGSGLSGDRFFYTNPLTSDGKDSWPYTRPYAWSTSQRRSVLSSYFATGGRTYVNPAA